MRKIIMAMAAGSALAMAAPAAAQYARGADMRIDQLQAEIQTGVRAGTIRRDDARTLREHQRVLRQTERTYALNGFTRAERQDLQNRIQNLRRQIRYAENVRGDRDDRYATADWIDRNRDGWDDRDFDRDGRWDDNVRSGSYGMGGPYDEVRRVCGARNSGIAGVIGSLIGADNCVDVGERVPSGLGYLPYDLRDQFRDGGGFYHRYLNGSVVQIDARTGTVVRIYDVY